MDFPCLGLPWPAQVWAAALALGGPRSPWPGVPEGGGEVCLPCPSPATAPSGARLQQRWITPGRSRGGVVCRGRHGKSPARMVGGGTELKWPRRSKAKAEAKSEAQLRWEGLISACLHAASKEEEGEAKEEKEQEGVAAQAEEEEEENELLAEQMPQSRDAAPSAPTLERHSRPDPTSRPSPSQAGLGGGPSTVSGILGSALEQGWLSRGDVLGLLVRCNQTKRFRCILLILEWLQSPVGSPWWGPLSPQDWCMFITAHTRVGDYAGAHRAFEAMRSAGVGATVYAWTALLEALCRAGDLAAAEALLRTMEEEGPPPTAVTYQTLLHAYCKAGRVADMERVIAALEHGVPVGAWGSSTGVDLPRTPAPGGEGAEQEQGVEPTVAGNDRDWARAVPASDASPGLETVPSLLPAPAAYAGAGGVPEECGSAEEAGLEHSESVGTAELTCSAEGTTGEGHLEEQLLEPSEGQRQGQGLELLQLGEQGQRGGQEQEEAMTLSHVKGGEIPHSDGSSGAEKRQTPDASPSPSASPLPPSPPGVGIPRVPLDAVMVSSLINAYASAGRSDDATRTFRRMKALGLVPPRTTYNILIAMFAQSSRTREAEGVLRLMQAANIRPDVYTYTALLTAYGRAGRAEEAQAVFRDMVMCKIWPSPASYTSLIDAYARAGDVEKAQRVFKEMSKRFPFHLPGYVATLGAYSKEGAMDMAENLLRRVLFLAQERTNNLQKPLLTLSPAVFNTVMMGYRRVLDLDKVVFTFERMLAAGVDPDQASFHLLITSYAACGDFDGAVFAYKEMVHTAGLRPDQGIRQALLAACKSARGDGLDEEEAMERRKEVLELLGPSDVWDSTSEGGVRGVQDHSLQEFKVIDTSRQHHERMAGVEM